MLPIQRERLHLARRAVVDIYLAGSNGRLYWPYRLQPAHDNTPLVRENSFKYILDSGYQNDDTGNTTELLLERAKERHPQFLIPNDAIRDDDISAQEAIEITAERVAEFLDAIDEGKLHSTVLVPLQPPYEDHLQYLRHRYPRQVRRSHFALGGLKPMSTQPERQRLHLFAGRELLGDDAYIHAFGLGGSRTLIETFRANPGLIDSFDFNTPLKHSQHGTIAGRSREEIHYNPASGTDCATTGADAAASELDDVARMLAPSLTDESDIALPDDEAEAEADDADTDTDVTQTTLPGVGTPTDAADTSDSGRTP